jgi:hypothetical protein
VGETVLVDLDLLPQELVNLVLVYQEQGIIDRNVDNGRFGMFNIIKSLFQPYILILTLFCYS